MKVAIITDAWRPQTNGVVTTLSRTGQCLQGMGHEVLFVTPEECRTVPLPTYPEIRLAVNPRRRVARLLEEFEPDTIHVATEAPLGLAARRFCRRAGLAFTTSYHTQFPEYIRMRAPVPLAWSYAYFRWFHKPAACTMVGTPTQRETLLARGFSDLALWSRGVDTELFQPGDRDFLPGERPIVMYMGRVATEKNIEAFMEMDAPGTKYVVGSGPQLEELKTQYPEVVFTGYKFGEELVRHVASADVFVFPSRTDTFGLVLLEAMACGVPVAAYPVTGPIDVVDQGVTGVLDENLEQAVLGALELGPEACRAHALKNTWEAATQQFVDNLVPARQSAAA